MIKVGIVGGAGYTAGELIRLLVHHSKVELDFVYSTSNAGNYIYNVHQDLLGSLDLKFTDIINSEIDVLFLCLGHGNSKKFLEQHQFSSTTKIIDLSNDFRLEDDAVFQEKEFVYGLPELKKEAIKSAKNIANPGCFATAIQLALLPLVQHNLIKSSVHINATTGSTGAGVSPSATTHFSWRDNNFSVYKAFTHQHLDEINESLSMLQKGFSEELFFIPNRGNFSRGIFASIYLNFDKNIDIAFQIYEDFYKESPFTHITKIPVHLKQVVNTNNCFIHLEKHNNTLLITSVLDNLLKGASGQAIQNMNLLYGFNETEGLQLKATSF
ncbi:N-acetyl-gamma-glutamyl-phosphate reductase [Lutibacter profundi]|uniref:N-acetyl-gamma-glutamyl-phosphate reductase n=1 Tax=Lutibacter profundi TaxID=1622118 RepID=A0A109RP33_9FLAO|nr:N-acetyl-gamma-glutamyl-phosphate reductase [Lutibacter profundi]AMC11741.1 N-acetyl-gamma-glutamyl-phosphate reductase [Lutibacter profundi]